MRRSYYLILFCLFFTFDIQVLGQESSETSSEGERAFYRKELYGGLGAHTLGFTAHFRYATRKTGYLKNIFAGELVWMKHPKEIRVSSSAFDNSRGFVYGKQNALVVLRTHYALNKILYTKDRKKGVQVGTIFAVGPSIGFEKPIYLEIRSFDFRSRTPRTEVFDPSVHNPGDILGRAPVLTGIEETKIVPGLNFKFALNFEYSPFDELVRAVEIGLDLDVFSRKVQMLALNPNKQFFLTAYLNIQFGQKFLE